MVWVMAIRVVEFSSWGTKSERFLHKNQATQRKLLSYEFWINGELSKIGHHFSNKVISELILSKSVNNKICAPQSVFCNEKKFEKDWNDF